MNYDEIIDFLKIELNHNPSEDEGTPVIIGSPGIGKSQMIEEIGKSLKKKVLVVPLYLYDVIESKGLPLILETEHLKTKYTTYAPADWIVENSDIILFDDIHLVKRDSQSVLFRVLREKNLCGHKIKSKIVCAMNPESDAGFKGFLSPVRNRCRFYTAEADTEGWLKNYAEPKGFYPGIIGFLKANQDCLNREPDSTISSFPTPRAWEYLNCMIKSKGEEHIKREAEACLGQVTGNDFYMYCKVFQKYDIAKMVKEDQLPKDIDVNDLYVVSYAIMKHLTSHKVTKCSLFEQIPEEVFVSVLQRLRRTDPRYHDAIIKDSLPDHSSFAEKIKKLILN